MAKSTANKKLQDQMADMAIAVPSIMSRRIWDMAVAGAQPSKRDQQEFQRMSTEKVTAFYQSWSAMWMEAAFLPLKLSTNWQAGANQDAMQDILAAGMEPIHKTAMANHRRLNRRKR